MLSQCLRGQRVASKPDLTRGTKGEKGFILQNCYQGVLTVMDFHPQSPDLNSLQYLQGMRKPSMIDMSEQVTPTLHTVITTQGGQTKH